MTARLASSPGTGIPGLLVPGMPASFVIPVPPAPPSNRIDGSRGIVYMSIASGAPASPVTYVDAWEVSAAAQITEVTPMGVKTKVYVAGPVGYTGSFDGWYDDASSQAYAAATDGIARNFYLYPAVAEPEEFFTGLILPDFAVSGGAQNAVAVKCSWSGASIITRVTGTIPVTVLQDEAFNDLLDQAFGVMS